MKIGIVSDSHGFIDNLKRAHHELKHKHGCEYFIHLGDDFRDSEDAGIILGPDVIRIPGVFHPLYKTGELEARVIREFDGCRFLLTHTRDKHKNDPENVIDPAETVSNKNAEVILYGHTHVPDIHRTESGVLLVNPGHLKDEDSKGYPPSFCVIEITPDKLFIKIFGLSYEDLLFEKDFDRIKG